MEVLDIKGVTDGPDSDDQAQVEGALKALKRRDLVVVHIEAPRCAEGIPGATSGKTEEVGWTRTE